MIVSKGTGQTDGRLAYKGGDEEDVMSDGANRRPSPVRRGALARKVGLRESDVAALFAAILDEVAAGRVVLIQGFGKFRPGLLPPRTFTTPIIGKVHTQERVCLRFTQARTAGARLSEAT